MKSEKSTLDQIKEYYGKTLQKKEDLKTNACCSAESPPPHLKEPLSLIHPEVLDKFYGCGSPFPSELSGRTVLDLGCGSGRDSYLLSKLVGPEGKVMGVDMTDEQLEVAKRHLNYHRKKFGYSEPNVQFLKGYIEDLEGLGIENGSVDLVISNCVINLSPEKERVFREIFRVLKPGGELYFSDVFAGRRIPKALSLDPTLRGECLGGAMYSEDFRRLLFDLGCKDFRVISTTVLGIEDPAILAKIGNIPFCSRTIRAFKLDLEDRCEDYGQVASYRGTLPESPHFFDLDDHHRFEKDRPMAVCSNTAAMLQKTRYGAHFEVLGDLSTHFGLFDCGPKSGAPNPSNDSGAVPCC